MKKTLSIAGTMFALLILGSTPAFAQHCGMHGGGDSGPAVFGGGEGGEGGCGCMGGHEGKHEGMHGKGGKMGPGFWKNPEMAKKLELTDAQIKKIDAIHEAGKKTGDAVHKEMKELKGSMKEAFKASPVDAARVKAVAEKISAKKAQMFMMHIQMKVDTMNVLTAKQKTALQEMKPAMGEGKCGCGGDCKCGKGGDCKCGEAGGCACGKAEGGCGCGGPGGCPMMMDDDDD